MHVSNETIYHSGDLEKIYKFAVENSEARGYYAHYDREVKLLSINYCSGSWIRTRYEEKTLWLSMPRRNKLQASALAALATAAIELPDEDSAFCYLAPQSLCENLVDRMIHSLGRQRKSHEPLPKLCLRYCNRMRKGQKQWQTIGKQRRHLEELLERQASIELAIVDAEKSIRLAEEFAEKNKARYKL